MASRDTGDAVNERLVAAIFERAASHRYDPAVYNEEDERAFECCRILFSKDYNCQVVSNCENRSAHYPAKLIIPVKENTGIAEQEPIPGQQSSDDSSRSFQAGLYENMFKSSQACRMNKRFPVPTILWNGKYLSRTGSLDVLSVATDMDETLKQEGSQASDFIFQINIATAAFFMRNMKFFSEIKMDVALLEYLDVNYICDLRVRDTSKSFPNFADSCEAYQKYYVGFTTVHMPYPGIGYFRKYHNLRRPKLLSCDLDKVSPPRYELALADIDCTTLFQTDLKKYERWSLHDITLNYLLVLQTYLTSDTLPRRGILLHCIAGQDRTPLFVTLLRLSFWADDLMHESLNPLEMLYLTVTYDWYMFGHDLTECLDKGYEIMHFCYNMLDRISSDRFSVRKADEPAARARFIPCCPTVTDRKRKLTEVKKLFLKFYARIERRPSQ
ncbi:myotubularin-related protein 14-like [Stegodyphus dumicola]|uniref:myotubularin-related protein 14-like n=1 Tax=Stegodyphus dumicola TaxID=202533 RepID=UPI0015B1EB5D|nr:myotubularin-related protein 14-like [Stegodyphus dumicola]